jgi:hypothetical protein
MLERLCTAGSKDRIILAPHGQQRWLVLPEILMPLGIALRIGAIVLEKGQLDVRILSASCSQTLALSRARSITPKLIGRISGHDPPVHLALSDPSIRRKRHKSAMNSAIGRGVRNGSAASCKLRSKKDALTPVRLHRANSLHIPWKFTKYRWKKPDGERFFQEILPQCSRLLAMFHV